MNNPPRPAESATPYTTPEAAAEYRKRLADATSIKPNVIQQHEWEKRPVAVQRGCKSPISPAATAKPTVTDLLARLRAIRLILASGDSPPTDRIRSALKCTPVCNVCRDEGIGTVPSDPDADPCCPGCGLTRADLDRAFSQYNS